MLHHALKHNHGLFTMQQTHTHKQEPNQDEEQAAFNALAIAAASQASSDEQGHSGPSLLEGRPRGSEEQTR